MCILGYIVELLQLGLCSVKNFVKFLASNLSDTIKNLHLGIYGDARLLGVRIKEKTQSVKKSLQLVIIFFIEFHKVLGFIYQKRIDYFLFSFVVLIRVTLKLPDLKHTYVRGPSQRSS